MGGTSNLITDCLILDGNPADTDLTDHMLDRHKDIYGQYTLKVALEGGFTSKPNLESAKGNMLFTRYDTLGKRDELKSIDTLCLINAGKKALFIHLLG